MDDCILKNFINSVEEGHYRTKPLPNMERIDCDELANTHFLSYRPEYKSSITTIPKNGADTISGEVYVYYDGTGVFLSKAWHFDYQGKDRNPNGWGNHMTVRLYKFSICDHSYKETSNRMCQHIYTCSKCNHSYETDSSD